jgi:hypothetical protein
MIRRAVFFPASHRHKNLLSKAGRAEQDEEETMILTPALVSSLFVVQYARKTRKQKIMQDLIITGPASVSSKVALKCSAWGPEFTGWPVERYGTSQAEVVSQNRILLGILISEKSDR